MAPLPCSSLPHRLLNAGIQSGLIVQVLLMVIIGCPMFNQISKGTACAQEIQEIFYVELHPDRSVYKSCMDATNLSVCAGRGGHQRHSAGRAISAGNTRQNSVVEGC